MDLDRITANVPAPALSNPDDIEKFARYVATVSHHQVRSASALRFAALSARNSGRRCQIFSSSTSCSTMRILPRLAATTVEHALALSSLTEAEAR